MLVYDIHVAMGLNRYTSQKRANAPIQPDFEVNPPLFRPILDIAATQRSGNSQVLLIKYSLNEDISGIKNCREQNVWLWFVDWIVTF